MSSFGPISFPIIFLICFPWRTSRFCLSSLLTNTLNMCIFLGSLGVFNYKNNKENLTHIFHHVKWDVEAHQSGAERFSRVENFFVVLFCRNGIVVSNWNNLELQTLLHFTLFTHFSNMKSVIRSWTKSRELKGNWRIIAKYYVNIKKICQELNSI